MTGRLMGLVTVTFSLLAACVDVPPETATDEQAIEKLDAVDCDVDQDDVLSNSEECGGNDCNDNDPLDNSGGCDRDIGCMFRDCDDPGTIDP